MIVLPRIFMKWLLIFSLFLAFSSRDAQAKPLIKLCYEDVPVYPWISSDGNGLVITEIHQVEKLLNMKFKLIRLPWKRCQLEARSGKIDGLIAASYIKERTEWGVYPTNNDGSLNRQQRLHIDSFIVVTRKDSPIIWKNKKFENLGTEAVGVQLGYSAGTDLKNAGYLTNSSFSSTIDILEAMDRNTIKVAVVQNYSLNKIISENARYQKYFERMEEPFKVVDQHLLFTKRFYEKNQALCKKIWSTIPAARESAEYVKLEKKMMGQKTI